MLYMVDNEFQFWKWLWRCDTFITFNYDTYVLVFNYMWSDLIPHKSRVLSILYHKNGLVWLNLFATHTYNYSLHLCYQYEKLGGWYFTVYRSSVRRWYPVGNWCVLIGTEVICWSVSTINKLAKLNLVAHMWSKDSWSFNIEWLKLASWKFDSDIM